jgi:NitT/TauT family transport system permease protein
MKPRERFLWPLLALSSAIIMWHFAVIWTHTSVFPAPGQVVRGLGEIMRKGLLLSYARDSLTRVSAGYLVAVALGIPAGLLLGWYPLASEAVNPVVQMLRPISPLAWTPVAIVWFGIGSLAPVFLIFLAAFFPILVATTDGVRNVSPMFRQAGQNFGLSPVRLLGRVILPAALPQILIGLRLALGVAWLVVVAAEMIAVNSGLGYLIIDSRNAGKRYDLVLAGMLLIGLIGLTLDASMRRLERLRATRWGFSHE